MCYRYVPESSSVASDGSKQRNNPNNPNNPKDSAQVSLSDLDASAIENSRNSKWKLLSTAERFYIYQRREKVARLHEDESEH